MTRSRWTPDDVGEALGRLPRHRASDGFTQRVVTAARRRPPRRRAPGRLVAAAAATVAIAATLALTLDRSGERRRREALAATHAELERRLALLEAEIDRPATVYLESRADYDLVLGLDPWLAESHPHRPSTVVETARH